MTQPAPKKYTNIGLYKQPSKEQREQFPNAKAYLSVNFGKKGPQSIVLNPGDVLQFTKKADKLSDLTKTLNSGKITQDTYDFLVGIYNSEEVIAEVTLVQKS